MAGRGRAHEDDAQDRRGEGSHEDGALGGHDLGGGGKRQAGDEDGHGEAQAAHDAHGGHLHPVHVLGELGKADLDQKQRHRDDAERLAQDGAEEDAAGHRVHHNGAKVGAHQAQLRVDEGKQRQDEEVHRGGDVVLHALQGRRDVVHDALHAHGGVGEAVLAQDVEALVVDLVEVLGAVLQPVGEVGEAHVGPAGQGKGQDDAGQRGVDAGVVHAEPQHQAHQGVGLERVDARVV